MLKRGCYQDLKDGLKESLRYLYDNPTNTYEDLVGKVIQIDGEKSGRHSVVSKSGIIDREPQTNDIVSQEMPDPVQELVKVLTAALQTDKKKAPQAKRKLQNKQAGAGSAQLVPNPGNTQVKSRVDRATARCNKCIGVGHFARECPSDKYLNSTRGENQATPQNKGQQGQNPNAPAFVPRMQVVNQPVTALVQGAQPQ